MKKLLIACLAILSLAMTGCNQQLIDLNYKFTKVHVFATDKCYEIKSWKDYEDSEQIQVNVKGYGTCLFYSNQIVLIESKCPFCE